MADAYDVAVIGAGPAGYPAAIRAAQNGLKVACIDDWKNHDGSAAFGGTCLNAGCIPSKAMLESTELMHRAQHEFAVHGIQARRRDAWTWPPCRSVAPASCAPWPAAWHALFKAAGVSGHLRARAPAAGSARRGDAHDGSRAARSQRRHVVLASGSVPTELQVGAASTTSASCDSWDALEFRACRSGCA